MSILIAAHNATGHLGETLDSIVAQSNVDWEAIVADDASTDQTFALAAGHHPQIRAVRSERNLGVAGARNLALAQARGELIALLDHDDLWLPEYLDHQLACYDAALARGENVGIVSCDAYELGQEGRRPRTYSERAGWVDEVTLTSLLRRNTIFASAIAPRAVVEQMGGFSTDCNGTDDFDLWLRIVESGRTVVAAREPLAVYRVHDAATSADVAGMARAIQAAYARALDRGALNWRQRLIARRELRLQQFVETWEAIASSRGLTGSVPARSIVRAVPLGARVIFERPQRWAHWLRIAISIARGAPAAGVDRSRLPS